MNVVKDIVHLKEVTLPKFWNTMGFFRKILHDFVQLGFKIYPKIKSQINA